MPSISIPAVTGAIATGLGGLGVGAETAGTIAAIASPMLSGAGLGAVGGALTGGNVGQDALFGALGGGGAGALGSLFPETMASLSPFSAAPATMDAAGNWVPGAGGFPAASAAVPTGMSAADASAYYGSGTGALSGAGSPLGQTSATAASGVPSTLKALLAAGQLAGAFAGPGRPNYGVLPGPAQNAATLGPLYNQGLGGGYTNRTQTPNYAPQSSWYNYGQYGGQPAFFQNNQLTFPGMKRGGALRLAYSRGGDHGYVAGGSGDGQSDSIPARLSDGEYVLTAADVSRIGNGSSRAGVLKLDHMRAQIAKDAGAKKIQGKVKEPMGYLRKTGSR